MESQRAQNKRSLLSAGVLLLSLAALQSPLWRAPQAVRPIAVRIGGAMRLASDRPISEIFVEPSQQASAALVGKREVLIRGRALGDAKLTIVSSDGHRTTYHVMVQPASARPMWGTQGSR